MVAEGPGSYTGLRIAVATAKTLAHTLNIELVGMSSLLALVPYQQEGLFVSLMDARRNNVYVGFYENAKPVMPEAHLPFERVIELIKGASQVTFVGEVGPFVEQIQEYLPRTNFKETLPNAANLALWAWDKEADSLHDFVPNYLKRVEAEENWLKNHTESGESYIKRL
ncbi:molecular chaperone [Streptococcus pneumoniae]|nr:molecular chaperone [Streptococcus pneumoniae]